MKITADIVVIGSGAGGGTMAYALRESGAKVLLLERGGFLPVEAQNSSARAVFIDKRYKPNESWLDIDGKQFQPGATHYFVGGNTKMYGACLARYREEDFGAYDLEDGPSPAWPITYDELAPYYEQAERVFRVHGRKGDDFMEPRRDDDYPFPPLPHHRVIEALAGKLREQGLRPYSLPMGLDLREGGNCVLSKSCDGFPCPYDAKSDADVCCVRPALLSDTVELKTHAYARRLVTDPSGRTVVSLEADIGGERVDVVAAKYVLSAGAVNSAALLLRSSNAQHPTGLANSSDQVGRNYLQHMNGTLIAVNPRAKNDAVFQKTLGVNDFYFGDADATDGWQYPLGSLQLIGKLQGEMVTSARRVPLPVANALARRSVDWWAFTEDTPLAENRVTLDPSGAIRVAWRPTNEGSQRRLLAAAARMMRRAGYPLIFTETHGVATNSHQAGTLRFGDDPQTSVLDRTCKAHDLTNLYSVDGSFHPSLGAGPGGPTLTIAAMALRVAAESDLTT